MGLPILNIGAGTMQRLEGQINADIHSRENIDTVFDACKPWPFADNSISSVKAYHVLEHLPDPQSFFKEAWRVLAPSKSTDGYNVHLRLPYGPSNGGISDLTHLRQWVPSSFGCFQPGYGTSVGNPQHDNWDSPFDIVGVYQRINPELRYLVRPIIRRIGVPILRFLWDGYIEMTVGLRALKTKDEITRFTIRKRPIDIPVASYMFKHEYEGRDLGEEEPPETRFFGENAKELTYNYVQRLKMC